jgi:hypothetical protein
VCTVLAIESCNEIKQLIYPVDYIPGDVQQI